MKIRFGFCPGGAVSACKGSAEEAHTEPAAANECWTNSLLVVSRGLQLGSYSFSIPNPLSWSRLLSYHEGSTFFRLWNLCWHRFFHQFSVDVHDIRAHHSFNNDEHVGEGIAGHRAVCPAL